MNAEGLLWPRGELVSLTDAQCLGLTEAQPWLSELPLGRHSAGSPLLPMSDLTPNELIMSFTLLESLLLFCSFSVLVQVLNSLSLLC